jgi:AraC-like DNA-binding protein
VISEAPERLLHERFMPLSTPFRLFKHRIDWHVTVHWHEFFELALVVSGTGTHILNGKAVNIGQRDLFLLTPADFHEIIPDPGQTLETYNAIFVQRFIRPELFQWLVQDGGGIALKLEEVQYGWLAAEFERMWDESENPRPGGDWLVAGALERVLVDAMRTCRNGMLEDAGPQSVYFHPSITKAVSYLQYHFREAITLDKVARHSGLSANHFSELFRKQIGVPFQNFVQDLRLKFAHSLLCMTDLPITDICYVSGFGTLSHFGRTFKNAYGVTPREARKEA